MALMGSVIDRTSAIGVARSQRKSLLLVEIIVREAFWI
jgi:hypothetical protein